MLATELDAVNLGQGFPNFPAPDFLKEAAARAVTENHNQYTRPARQDSAEDFSRLDALLFTAMAWIFIPAYCFALP